MTAVSDRVAFKELCITTLQAHYAAAEGFDAVSVHYDDPGENPSNVMVILGEIKGNATAEVFGPAGSDDEFTIDAVIYVAGGNSSNEADQRSQELLNELNACLFQSRFAVSLGGRAFPGKQDGPNGVDPLDGAPAQSAVELTIGCSISLRGA